MTTNNAESELSIDERLERLGDLSAPPLRALLKGLSNLSSAEARRVAVLWPEIPAERRFDIVARLSEMAEENVEFHFGALFQICLDDHDPGVRRMAVEGLWEDERPVIMRTLITLLADSEGDVRTAAALGLARFAYQAVLGELSDQDDEALREALLEAVLDPDQPLETRRRAVEALGYFADWDEAQAEVGRAYAHPEQMMRESSVVAMGRSMRLTWLPMIEREIRSPSPALRYEAARAAGEFGEDGRRLLSPLLPLLEDDDPEIAMAAIWAFGQIGGDQAKRTLQRVARSNDPARRQAAEEALSELELDSL